MRQQPTSDLTKKTPKKPNLSAKLSPGDISVKFTTFPLDAHLDLYQEIPQVLFEGWDVLIEAEQTCYKHLHLGTEDEKTTRCCQQHNPLRYLHCIRQAVCHREKYKQLKI